MSKCRRGWGQTKPPLGCRPIASAVQDLGLVFAAVLNEGGGGFVTDLIGGTIGTLNGDATWGGQNFAPWTTGSSIKCSVNGYVNFGTVATQQPTAQGTIAVSGLTSTAVAQKLLGYSDIDADVNGVSLFFGQSGANLRVVVEVTSATTFNQILVAATLSLPYRIVATWNGSNIYLYLNGQLAGTTAQTLTVTSGVNPITMGANDPSGTPDDFLNGYFDVGLIANRAWNPDQVMQDFLDPFSWIQPPNNVRPPRPPAMGDDDWVNPSQMTYW